MPPASLRRFVAASVIVSALAGALAGLVDAASVMIRVPGALPQGKLGFVTLLVTLYAGTAGLVAGIVGAVAFVVTRWTDLGTWIARGFAVRGGERDRVRPWWAYAAASVPLVLAHYWASHAFVLDALQRYHHAGLIAALSTVVSVGFALLALLLWPVIAAIFGVRARRALDEKSAPALFVAFTMLIAIVAVLVGVGAYLFVLQGKARVPNPLRAVGFARAATASVIIASGIVVWLARRFGRAITSAAWRSPTRLAFVLGAGVIVPSLAASAYGWATVKQLDFRPVAALASFILTIVVLNLGKLLAREPSRQLTGVAVAGAAVLLIIGLQLGNNGRIRRVAVEHAGLMPFVSRGLQAISDRDGDGYAALLGGGDCNDSDPSVHPGAFDWPDDGIDQDCNGHQATLTPERERRWASALPATVPRDMNVLLITIDALRSDHLGMYGYARPTSPVLDALARSDGGFLFVNAWSHAPSTRYSIPAIITGRYPSTIAVSDASVHWPPRVLPENRLLAEMLKDLGYQTAATLSYHYFERGWGLDQGFDDYDYSLEKLHSLGGDPAKTHGSSARELTDLNMKLFDARAQQGKKFFLWTHYYDTHFDFQAHPDEPITNFGDKEIDLYDAEIRYTDIQLGRLFDKLRALGMWEKTIIVITADHGDGFGEHGIPPNRRHGYHLYRTETKVPLLIRVPGMQSRAVTTMASHIDIVPTILNLLGEKSATEPQLLGDSLVDFMTGNEDAGRRVFQEVWYEGPTSKKAVVDQQYHYIRNLVPEDTAELYDEVADPAEDHDQSGASAAETNLASALAAWMDEIAIPLDFRKKVEGALSLQPIVPKTTIGADIGKLLTLDGVDVVTPTVRIGETAEFDLIWHVNQPAKAGWRIFAHVTSASGQNLNADHQPIENLLPLQQTRRGQYLRDRMRVIIPANWAVGKTKLTVGLWRPNERAPIKDQRAHDNAIDVGTVEVVR